MRNPLLKFTHSSRFRRLLLLGLFFVVSSTYGNDLHAQKYNISITDKPLTTAFGIISEQTGYKFVYGNDNLDGLGNVTLNARNASINSIMDACVRETGLGYRIEGRDIIIVSPKLPPAVKKRTITGHVYDEKGAPLAGATIMRVGVNLGAISDADGYFTMQVNDEEEQLRVSFLGMEPQNVSIKERSQVSVRLKPTARDIESVVVTAYGLEQKKEDLVGSAYQVNAGELKTLPVVRVDKMLEGLVPGFTISPNADYSEGRQRYNVRIRGESSLSASGEPIWIIDGMRMYTGDRNNAISGSFVNVSPLSLVDPNDIESITVLKDATQTSIYGADGANGVVLITTKRPLKGELRSTVSVRYGIGTTDNSTKLKIVNGPQYLMLAEEAWLNAGNSMATFPWQDNHMNRFSTTDTDWFDEFFGMAHQLSANVSLSGGGERMSNRVSFGYMNDRPITLGNTTNRFSTRFNSKIEISRSITLEAMFGFTYALNNVFGLSEGYLKYLPIYSPTYDDSSAYRLKNVMTDIDGVEKEYRFFNSLPERDENTFLTKNIKPIGGIILKYEPITGLRLSGDFNIDYNGVHDEMYSARTNLSGASWIRENPDDTELVWNPYGSSRRNMSNNLRWQSTESIMFDRMFGKHSVFAQAGIELSSESRQTMQVTGYGFPNDKMQEVSYSDADTRTASSSSSKTRKLSYMARVNYSYDSRYYISGTYRHDGSSVFGKYHQWEPFFSVGGSWNIHNEKFFNAWPISKLKVRASYGSVGNSRIDNILTNGSYTSSVGNGYRGSVGGTMSLASTAGLSWERVYKTNLGLDISLFKRLDITLEYYIHNTTNIIADMGVSMLTGERNKARNMGLMRNKGVELDITSRNINNPDFKWNTSFNISHNKNKVVKLNEESSKSFFEYGWYEGQEKNVYTVIEYAGVDPADGSPMYYDANGNLTKNYSYGNRVAQFDRSRYPTVYGGMVNNFVWKDFDLRVALVFSIGGWGYAKGYSYVDDGKYLNNLTSAGNVLVEMLDRWQKPGDITYVPKLISDVSRNSMSYNTRRLINKTNIRLSNLALGYTIPEHIAAKMKMKSVKVSFIADNLFIWTPNASKTRNSYKTLMSTTPIQRTFSLELSITL